MAKQRKDRKESLGLLIDGPVKHNMDLEPEFSSRADGELEIGLPCNKASTHVTPFDIPHSAPDVRMCSPGTTIDKIRSAVFSSARKPDLITIKAEILLELKVVK